MLQKFLFLLITLLICPSFLSGCEPKQKWDDFQGGIHFVLEVESSGNSSVDQENTTIIRDLLAERARQFGIKNKIITIDGERTIIVQLPKLENHQRIIALLGKSYFLEFKFVDDESSLEEALKGNIPDGREILYQKSYDPKTGSFKERPYLIFKKASLSGQYIKKAKVQLGQRKEPHIGITFTDTGAKILRDVTKENIGKQLAIILDNKIYTAPRINAEIPSGQAQITGHFTIEEASNLTRVLNSGSYPVPVKIINQDELTKELWMER